MTGRHSESEIPTPIVGPQKVNLSVNDRTFIIEIYISDNPGPDFKSELYVTPAGAI